MVYYQVYRYRGTEKLFLELEIGTGRPSWTHNEGFAYVWTDMRSLMKDTTRLLPRGAFPWYIEPVELP